MLRLFRPLLLSTLCVFLIACDSGSSGSGGEDAASGTPDAVGSVDTTPSRPDSVTSPDVGEPDGAAADSAEADVPEDQDTTIDVTPNDVVAVEDVATPDGGAEDVQQDAAAPDVAADVTGDIEADVTPDTAVGPVCGAGTRWEPGTPAFVERTEEWGLAGVGAEGTRLSIVDVDGDGWADLLVRRGGTRSDDFGAEGSRHTWLLRNVPGGGFEDVTLASDLLVTRQTLGADIGRPNQVYAMADVDNDGDLDLYSGADTADPAVSLGETSELLLNDGTGAFTLAEADSAVRRADLVDMPAGATFLDFDRDGNIDLWVGQHNYDQGEGAVFQSDRMFRGDGAGGFTDVTAELGLMSEDWGDYDLLNGALAHTRTWATAACDLNGDGMPELLSASYGRSPNHLWQGDPDSVTYENRGLASGYAYDENFDWTSNQFARCYCKSLPHAEDCEGVLAPVIECGGLNWSHSQDRQAYRLGGNSATTVCADVDNDGDMDLLTTEIRHWWAGNGSDWSELLLNTGADDVTLERPGRNSMRLWVPHEGWTWDEGIMTAAVFDFDNDGWNDIYLGGSDYAGNRGLLYHQGAPLTFAEVDPADFFEHNRSHGVVVADFDHDGDLDIAVGHSRARCDAGSPNDCYETAQVRIFENVIGQDGNWLQLRLAGGPDTNRAAIGARVTVTAGGVTQTQEIDGGHGHYNTQKDLVLHFGLGDACEAEVTVRWPDAALTTEIATLHADQRWHWTQGGPPIAASPAD